MTPRNVKNVVSGAILGSILGSLSAMIISNHKLNRSGWAKKARNIGERVFDEVKHWSEPEHNEGNSIFVKGAFLGLLIGAGSALLLTPKTGNELRKDLIEGYQDIADKTQEILDYVNHKEEVVKKRPIKKAIKKHFAVSKAKIKAKH